MIGWAICILPPIRPRVSKRFSLKIYGEFLIFYYSEDVIYHFFAIEGNPWFWNSKFLNGLKVYTTANLNSIDIQFSTISPKSEVSLILLITIKRNSWKSLKTQVEFYYSWFGLWSHQLLPQKPRAYDLFFIIIIYCNYKKKD